MMTLGYPCTIYSLWSTRMDKTGGDYTVSGRPLWLYKYYSTDYVFREKRFWECFSSISFLISGSPANGPPIPLMPLSKKKNSKEQKEDQDEDCCSGTPSMPELFVAERPVMKTAMRINGIPTRSNPRDKNDTEMVFPGAVTENTEKNIQWWEVRNRYSENLHHGIITGNTRLHKGASGFW